MTRITGPHLTAERLVAFVHAQLMAIAPKDEVACVVLYRSELAMLVQAVDALAAEETTNPETPQRASLGDCVAAWNDHQDEPTLEAMTEEELLRGLEVGGYTEPAVNVSDAARDEFIRGLNPVEYFEPALIRTYEPQTYIGDNGRLFQPEDVTEATGPLVVTRRLTPEALDRLASTRPKEYGAGKRGPVEIRRPGWPPSAYAPAMPAGPPASEIAGSIPGTAASTGPSADAVAAHTDRIAGGRTRSVRRGLGET